jgi:hypothetical protein
MFEVILKIFASRYQVGQVKVKEQNFCLKTRRTKQNRCAKGEFGQIILN